MRKSTLTLLVALAAVSLTGCEDPNQKPTSGAYQLTTPEITAVNSSASRFFSSKVLVVDGKSYQGESMGCMGSDSDRDMNVTCTGNEPAMQGGAVYMKEREILCNYAGAAAGCKKKS